MRNSVLWMLGCAVATFLLVKALTCAVYGDGSGVARPACEATPYGEWTKTGRRCTPAGKSTYCRDVHACRYPVTDRIGEVP